MKMIEKMVVLVGAAVGLTGASAWADPATSTASNPSSDEVRATVAEYLGDAESRSSLLAGGDAGHDDRGFFIAGDGFRLNVGGQLQFRYVADFRNNDNPQDFNHGFDNVRTRMILSGTVNKDWDFKIYGDFESNGGSFVLQDAWARYNFANGLKLKWGQFVLPLLQEWNVWDSRQLAVERSEVSSAFGQDWSQGIQLSYGTDNWRLAGAFSDGLNSANTGIASNPQSNQTPPYEGTSGFFVAGKADWAVTGRAEYIFQGNWKQFDDFTSPRGSDFGWMLGGAAHYQQNPNTNNPTDVDRDTFEYTADLTFKGNGWNIFGMFVGRYEQFSQLAASSSHFNDFGGLVQGGYYFTEKLEAFARWDALFPDTSRFSGSGNDQFHFLTAGVNYYFAGHAAKWTTDAVISLNKTDRLQAGLLLPDNQTGLQGQNKYNEVMLRTQFQLLF